MQVVEVDPRVRELKWRIAMMKIKRVAAVVVAALSKQEPDVLKVQAAELDAEVSRSHIEVKNFKHLRAETNRLGRDVEKVTALLTDRANMLDEDVERADNLSAQLAASVCCEDAYKSKISPVKDDLVKTRVESTHLRWLANNLVAKVREAFGYLGGVLCLAVKRVNLSSEAVADKAKA